MSSGALARPVHPRVRGEQGKVLSGLDRGTGSSPRARGTVEGEGSEEGETRFIPACAGNRHRRTTSSYPTTVHPRVRGEQKM